MREWKVYMRAANSKVSLIFSSVWIGKSWGYNPSSSSTLQVIAYSYFFMIYLKKIIKYINIVSLKFYYLQGNFLFIRS